jgi:SAM-dependent methyltransferase
MAEFDASRVRRYYDRQTAGFLAFGQGGTAGAIHRAVWGPGVSTREGAFHFVEDRIVAALQEADGAEATPHVVDLGCGVGGSLTYVASRLPVRGTGVTLSPVQARLARQRIDAMGLGDCVTCLEADYTRLPASIPPADLGFAIESFVHGPSPAAFFAECARLIRPGGLLMICDDLKRPAGTGRGAERTLRRFRAGWHVNTLITRDMLVDAAAAAGFACEEATDLTAWLELGRPRDRALAVLVAAFGWLPLERTRFGHVVGGTALQTALRRGWIAYELLRFRRGPITSARGSVCRRGPRTKCW